MFTSTSNIDMEGDVRKIGKYNQYCQSADTEVKNMRTWGSTELTGCRDLQHILIHNRNVSNFNYSG